LDVRLLHFTLPTSRYRSREAQLHQHGAIEDGRLSFPRICPGKVPFALPTIEELVEPRRGLRSSPLHPGYGALETLQVLDEAPVPLRIMVLQDNMKVQLALSM
jgi:hypothetical protein